MKHRVSLEGAINFTKMSVRVVCTWPPPSNTSEWRTVTNDVIWSLCVISVFCLLIPLINAIPEVRTDSIIMTQTVCYCSACTVVITKAIITRLHRKKLQALVHEMEEFIKSPLPHERRILQRYVDGCWIFHGMITLMNYLGSLTIISGPFIFPHQKLPTNAIYPFSIDSGIVMYLVFVHQSFIGLQTSAALTVDCQMALIMWFAGARLEILAEEIEGVFDSRDFRSFGRKHQRLLEYATKVSETMAYVALNTACVGGVAFIVCSIQLVGDQPLIVKLQFAPVALINIINLLVSAWPTENLMRTRYVDKCWALHAGVTFLNYFGSVAIIGSSFLFDDQKMPSTAIYPFSVDSGLTMYLVYIHQSFVGLQTCAAITADCQIALMMWFAAARLEILAEEVDGEAFGADEFQSFVRKHAELLSYATKVSETMRYITFITVCVGAIGSISAGIQLAGNQPLIIKMQFAPIAFIGLINLLISAWPAECIIRVCDLIGARLYNIAWVEMSPKFSRNVIMILQCSQRPVQVSISGFLPALSFHFYSSFLSGVFSYFTTIRALILAGGDEK